MTTYDSGAGRHVAAAARARGADEPQPTSAGHSGVGGLLVAALAGFVLVGLVVGVPAALVRFLGEPVSGVRAGDLSALTADPAVSVAAALGWVLWSCFVVLLVLEWRAAARGSHRRGVPALAPLQAPARWLARAFHADAEAGPAPGPWPGQPGGPAGYHSGYLADPDGRQAEVQVPLADLPWDDDEPGSSQGGPGPVPGIGSSGPARGQAALPAVGGASPYLPTPPTMLPVVPLPPSDPGPFAPPPPEPAPFAAAPTAAEIFPGRSQPLDPSPSPAPSTSAPPAPGLLEPAPLAPAPFEPAPFEPAPDLAAAPLLGKGAVAPRSSSDAPGGSEPASGVPLPGGEPIPDVKYYLVDPPLGHHHDCLWDIAERTLGDPRRYPEIFDLNRNRLQPDGLSLQDADLIRAGWILRLPPDARGQGVLDTDPHLAGAPTAQSSTFDQGAQAAPNAALSASAPTASASVFLPQAPFPAVPPIQVPAVPTARPFIEQAEREQAEREQAEREQAEREQAEREQAEREQAEREQAEPAATHGVGATTGLPGRGLDRPGQGQGHGADGDVDEGREMVTGGLALAGLLATLAARRGPYGDPDPQDQPLRRSADPWTAGAIDLALRSLAAAVAEGAADLPEITAVFAGPHELIVQLAGPSNPPPAPWRADVEGTWSVRFSDLASTIDQLPADLVAPYPALVNVARTRGFEILLDLEAAPGLISLAGPGGPARELAVSLGLELATNGWSDGVDVTMVGFGDELRVLGSASWGHSGGAGLQQVARLAQALTGVERAHREHRELLTSLGLSGVLAGRSRPGGPMQRPHVIVMAAPPTPDEAARIHALTTPGRTPLAVVCVGESDAGWRLELTDDAGIDLAPLGLSASARRCPPQESAVLLGLLRKADRSRQEQASAVLALSPRGAAQLAGEPREGSVDPAAGAGAQAADGALPQDADPATPAPAGVEIRLLGPVEVEVVVGAGAVDAGRIAPLSEAVVAVALSRQGATESDLQTALAGVAPAETIPDLLAEAAQWLGPDASGHPRLIRDESGRWVLGDDVRCDWDVFRSLAARAQGEPEARLLTAALLLGRGAVFSTPDPLRYGWLGFHRAARDARVLAMTTARRAAVLATADGRPQDALTLLRQGLVLVPTAESLWNELLRITGAEDPGSAVLVEAQLRRTLRAHGVRRPEPATEAALAALADVES